jgi:hypothetical protein
MPLARERAATTIVDIYRRAKKSIVATNVGSTDFYFGDGTYASANVDASRNHVPIVRFYVYSEKQKSNIKMHDGKHPDNIDAFYREVKHLHNSLGSLYSALIDADRLNVEKPRDLLIVDDTFLAETLQTQKNWEVMRAQATENKLRLKDARDHFRLVLAALDPKYIERMKPDEVKSSFKLDFTLGNGQDPAQALFDHLMKQVTGS